MVESHSMKSAPRGGVSQWKRQVTVFAMLMIALVIGVAAVSGALMWHMLRDVAASGLKQAKTAPP